MLERGIGRVDHGLGQQRSDVTLGKRVAELLLEQVADHALALGAEHVERVAAHVGIRLVLQREQTDLRSVAVRHHEPVLAGDRGK